MEKKPIDQIAQFLNGLALQKYPATGSDFLPVIKIAELRAGNTMGSDKASADLPREYVVEDGDICFRGPAACFIGFGPRRGALNQHLFKVTPAGLSEVVRLFLD